jgi:hypothetical protein
MFLKITSFQNLMLTEKILGEGFAITIAVKERLARTHVFSVLNFLSQGCQSSGDYFSFHYHLAVITELLNEKAELKEIWKCFLSRLHHQKIRFVDGRSEMEIDCSIEMRRMRGEKTELLFEEFKFDRDAPHSKADEVKIEELNAIYYESYPDYHNAHRLISLFNHSRCFVLKERESLRILGCVFIAEGNKELLIHTLARKACFVKCGVTEKFALHLQKIFKVENYKNIICHVLEKDQFATNLYHKLGFKIFEKFISENGEAVLVLLYEPNPFVVDSI